MEQLPDERHQKRDCYKRSWTLSRAAQLPSIRFSSSRNPWQDETIKFLETAHVTTSPLVTDKSKLKTRSPVLAELLLWS